MNCVLYAFNVEEKCSEKGERLISLGSLHARNVAYNIGVKNALVLRL